MSTPHDAVIIGSGPAGLTAALYLARALRTPLVLAGMQPGGQLTVTTEVENFPGFPEPILGPELMTRMREQAEKAGAQVVSDQINSVDLSTYPFALQGEERNYTARSLIIATGARAQWLGVPGEDIFRGFGVSACAVCDGFFFRGKTVAVVGGGNTAVEEALYLTAFAKKVYLIHRRDTLRAEPVLQKRLLADSRIVPLWNRTVVELRGNEELGKSLTHAVLRPTDGGEDETLALDGLFVAIGHVPATEAFRSVLACDSAGYITVTPGTTRTSVPGVFAAGDVADQIYRQAVTAAGTGCMAALDALRFLDERS